MRYWAAFRITWQQLTAFPIVANLWHFCRKLVFLAQTAPRQTKLALDLLNNHCKESHKIRSSHLAMRFMTVTTYHSIPAVTWGLSVFVSWLGAFLCLLFSQRFLAAKVKSCVEVGKQSLCKTLGQVKTPESRQLSVEMGLSPLHRRFSIAGSSFIRAGVVNPAGCRRLDLMTSEVPSNSVTLWDLLKKPQCPPSNFQCCRIQCGSCHRDQKCNHEGSPSTG